MDDRCVQKFADLNCDIVLDRLKKERFSILTFDFDGSVISTKSGKTEGTAVGFNKTKKGSRSYYPILATVAQTGQVYRVRNRPGNVHDSNGAKEFIADILTEAKRELPCTRLESRLDSAHFNENTCFWLDDNGIEFTITVPFERFSKLKTIIESRKRWKGINKEWSFFEQDWRPKKWNQNFRFIFYRQKVKKQLKGPIQLDLFVPIDTDYDYKVVVTNKTAKAKAVLFFHNGRGSQETIFGDMKTDCPLDYIPTRRRIGNEIWMLSAVMAHNLSHEIQMRSLTRTVITSPKRACRYVFEKLGSIRHRIIQRAGRLTRPNGILTLTMSGNESVAQELNDFLSAAAGI
jgi:Holliday junction resolvase RusA-like endonuclease